MNEGEWWIEAKTVLASDEDRAAWQAARRRGPDGFAFRSGSGRLADFAAIQRKLDSHLDDAILKWERQAGGRFALFVDIAEIDADVIDDDELWARIGQWAIQMAAEKQIRIVVCDNFGWESPRVDAQPRAAN